MYENFFGLRELPFGLTPDTEFFYANSDHQEALNTLLVALQMGEGFIKVSGEVGTGKTLVCRKLLNELANEQTFATAYVPNPTVTPAGLLVSIIKELGAESGPDQSPALSLEKLNGMLVEYKHTGHKVVLVVDEAQALSHESLETVRLLTNLETEKSKLVQVVLFGQPELDERLAEKGLRQLAQRITFSHRLKPMQTDVVAGYLAHRMAVAGYQGPALFSLPLATQLHQASGGIPRLLNILAHKTLLAAFGEGRAQLTKRHVQRAIEDTESTIPQTGFVLSLPRWVRALATAGTVAGVVWTAGLV